MSSSINGFWVRPSDSDENISDFLWVGENGRMVHRINYSHGPFVMLLWSRHLGGDKYEVRLKPKSEPHHVMISLQDGVLTLEHLDLKNPKAQFSRTDENQIPDLFAKDLKWAEKSMDKSEKD